MARRTLGMSLAPFALVVGCASGADHAPELVGAVEQSDAVATPQSCTSGITEGCPCTDAGADATAECTALRFGYDGYKSCSPGTRYCGDDGKWGACIGPAVFDAGAP